MKNSAGVWAELRVHHCETVVGDVHIVLVLHTRPVLLTMTLVNLNLFLVVFEDKFDPHRKEQAIWD